MGRIPAENVIKDVRVFHLTDGSFETCDVAVSDGIIVDLGREYTGRTEIDGRGLTAVPGFIDAHVHLESSLVSPLEFSRMVLPRGVTTVVCDPHELANVCGTAAFDYMFNAARQLPLSMHVNLSSCVPAASMETSGGNIDSVILAKWHRLHPESGLAEMMNVPGVLNKDPEVLSKILEFGHIDGHCPLVSGKSLNAYIAAGIRNCHECSNLDEAREKLRRGMQILIREGTAARNLDDLLPLLTLETSMNCSFCTDDRTHRDIQQEGHIDSIVRRALSAGIAPLAVYRAASYSTASSMGLNDRGLIIPGMRADIVLLKNLEACSIDSVLCGGRFVNDSLFRDIPVQDDSMFRNSVHLRKITAKDFPFTKEENAPVIGITSGMLTTDFCRMSTDSEDVLRLAVLERHGKNGNIGLGWIHGLGLKDGAIATSIGHDSHNICVAGTNAEDMALAVNAIRDIQGGFCIVHNHKIAATLPLPLAGLMSDQPYEVVARQEQAVMKAIAETGCPLHHATLQLAFLVLPVIPHLKLTDKGLVDVDKFCFVK